MSKRGSGSSARAGEVATNARNIENMNEAQLNKEISKLQDKIQNLDASMSRNLEESGYSKAMRDAFPLSSGGAGWSTAGKTRQERERTASLKKAKNYVDARTQKESAAKKLSVLQKAKKTGFRHWENSKPAFKISKSSSHKKWQLPEMENNQQGRLHG